MANAFLYKYLLRDKFIEQEKQKVEQEKKKLTMRGTRPREAMRKIKQAIMRAIK